MSLKYICVIITKLEVILIKQAWTIKDLLYGQKENFFLRDKRGKSRESERGPSFSGNESEYRIQKTHTKKKPLRSALDFVQQVSSHSQHADVFLFLLFSWIRETVKFCTLAKKTSTFILQQVAQKCDLL